jgi:hypothetical protein
MPSGVEVKYPASNKMMLLFFSADIEEDKEDENGLNLKGKDSLKSSAVWPLRDRF